MIRKATTEGLAWEAECAKGLDDYQGGDLGGARVAMWHTQAARARDYILVLELRLRDAEDTLREARLREQKGAPKVDRMANLSGYWARNGVVVE